jgi:cell division transport system ATP-binding protein
MITFSKVYKRYASGREALKNINLTIEAGEMAFFTGHSGAGKSTLLKMLAAVELPSSGTLIVNGQNINSLRPRTIPYLRRNLGLIFQDQKLLFDRTVFENVMLPLQISSFDEKEGAKRVRAALDKVGLLSLEKAYPITLSGGEQQRLCIARAVVHRPNILIADEPTASLDAAYALEIMNVFKSFNQVGVTILVATHDQALTQSFASKVFNLHQGQLST